MPSLIPRWSSAIFSGFITYPLDTVRRRMQMDAFFDPGRAAAEPRDLQLLPWLLLLLLLLLLLARAPLRSALRS